MTNNKPFIKFRRELHQFPEISSEEFETKKRVRNFMNQFNPHKIYELGKTGIAFEYCGKTEGKSIMMRAELDALPIQETNVFSYSSVYEGKSHKCGHDGHMTILAQLAQKLNKTPLKKGRAILLFQPAEENGEGAKEVTNDRNYFKLNPDWAISLHNIPGYPMHEIILIENEFTPAVKSIIVKWKGKTSHAAEPEKGLNPAAAMSEFISRSLDRAQTDQKKENFFLVTPIYQTMGEKAYGVSAGYGETHLTLRANKNDFLNEQAEKIKLLAKEIAEKHGLSTTINFVQEFNAIKNDKEVNLTIEKAAKQLGLSVTKRKESMKWGEDFGLFTELHKGAMFGLGAGEKTPALHNPDYDFPEELIDSGSKMFEFLVREYLEK